SDLLAAGKRPDLNILKIAVAQDESLCRNVVAIQSINGGVQRVQIDFAGVHKQLAASVVEQGGGAVVGNGNGRVHLRLCTVVDDTVAPEHVEMPVFAEKGESTPVG